MNMTISQYNVNNNRTGGIYEINTDVWHELIQCNDYITKKKGARSEAHKIS